MATVREYYDSDFKNTLRTTTTVEIHSREHEPVQVSAKIHFDNNAHSKFLSFFLPRHPNPIDSFRCLINQIDEILNHFNSSNTGVEVQSSYTWIDSKPANIDDFLFSGAIYFYLESDINKPEFDTLKEETSKKKLFINLIGEKQAIERSRLETPQAFICHDSRDKETIARPIAIGLQSSMCTVWYDEFSLKVGDSLRESIEKGLKECKKCILVITPNFIGNEGWPKKEFNSIFTKELIEKENCILPIWCGITKEQVYDYSPSLADRVAANWDQGEREVIKKLLQAIL